MQGAEGISAPVSVTFLNAMRLDHPVFIVTISAFFAVMAAIQFPALWSLGLLDDKRLLQSLFAAGLLFAGMPVGERLARRISPRAFDRAMLILLAAIALRLIRVAAA